MDDAPPSYASMPGSYPGSYPVSYPGSYSSSSPSTSETPKPAYDKGDENDKIMTEIKTFETELNGKKYNLDLAKSESNKNIIIKVEEKRIRNFSNYIVYLNYNQLNNINSIFSFYKNIDEIYDLLLNNLSEKKFSLSLDDYTYKITFTFLMPGEKTINVDFYLKEEKANNTMIMNDIYKIIDKLEEENKIFKEEINKLKNEDKKLKEELDLKNNELIFVKNELKDIKNENKLMKEKIKQIEDNLKNNNNIKNEKKDFLNENKDKDNHLNNKDNNKKNEILKEKEKENKKKNEVKNESESKINKNKYECSSVPNSYNNCNNNNYSNSNYSNNKIISNKIPKNIIIDEDDEEKNEINENKINSEKKESLNNTNSNNNNKSNINTNISKKSKSTPVTNLENIANIDFDNLFLNSKLIVSKKEKMNLYTWLTTKGGKIKEIKLIFNSSNDGDSYNTFIEKCGDKGPTLSVIQSKNKKRFGGFSKAQWTDKKGKIKLKDEKAFVFSLDKLKKYDVLQPEIAIACIPGDYLLMYGNNDNRYGLRVAPGFLEDKNNYEHFGKKSYDVPENFGLSGENIFFVEELEIFKIVFE